eukprot:CAMPEP_0194122994 /NCGR_PEP_ID=MMETSP0150-20130528/52756_1 /TAXON_ID=122233 /ORGANISM="Chaetoceros debilis, Strain MM31A-1" /LENGTH=33 /DNA_ID= /DNA_START= /DNA_END= /DNA_ORIENTATION=
MKRARRGDGIGRKKERDIHHTHAGVIVLVAKGN